MKSKWLNTSKDFLLNIIASLVYTGAMQLVVYPRLASALSAAEYGEMLTVMGLVNIVVLAFGNNLCNARLLVQSKYNEQNMTGDFQLMVLIMGALSAVVILISNLIFGLKLPLLLAVVVATVFGVWKSYYLVTYRITIDYDRNLWVNVVMSLAFVVGALLLSKIVAWPWIFTVSHLAGLVYIFFNSGILREPLRKTPLLGSTSKVVIWLIFSGLIGNLTTYLDRFILYPTLGSESVSVYSTSAFFSKSINLVLVPISSVLLSYITAGKLKINRKRYFMLSGAILAMTSVFYLVSVTIGRWITRLLYPTLIDMAAPYIAICSLAILVGVTGVFFGVSVMAYAPTYWQFVSAAIKLMLYVGLGVYFVYTHQILGLCISVLISNFVGVVLNFFVGYYYIANKKQPTQE